MPSLKEYLPPVLYFDSVVSLVDFNLKSQIEQKNNLFGDGYDLPAEKKVESEDAADEKYVPFIKQELNLHIVYDNSIYKSRQEFIPMIASFYNVEQTLGMYEPIVYLSDFWVLMRDLILLDKERVELIAKV